MTIADLIEVLGKLPKDLEVGVPRRDGRLTEPTVELTKWDIDGFESAVVVIGQGYAYAPIEDDGGDDDEAPLS